MRRRAIAFVLLPLLALAAWQHPRADIRVLTHDVGDRAPARVLAAVDLGLASVSVLVTWTRHLTP